MQETDLGATAAAARRALHDPALLARFTAAYAGIHEPGDALQWLAAPGSTAPSGAVDPAVDLAQLRSRLYRPEANDDDRRRYAVAAARVRDETDSAADALLTAVRADATDSAAPAAQRTAHTPGQLGERSDDPPRPGGRRARYVAGVAGVAGVLLVLGGVTALALPRAAPEAPAPTPTPLASGVVDSSRHEFVGTAAQQHRQRTELAALFTSARTETLGSYLFAHRLSLGAILPADRFAVDYRGRGPAEIPLTGLDGGGASNALTVLLTCERSAPYAWSMSAVRDAAPAVPVGRTSGADCGGALITSSFVPPGGQVPTSMRITVPAEVEFLVEVDLIRS